MWHAHQVRAEARVCSPRLTVTIAWRSRAKIGEVPHRQDVRHTRNVSTGLIERFNSHADQGADGLWATYLPVLQNIVKCDVQDAGQASAFTRKGQKPSQQLSSKTAAHGHGRGGRKQNRGKIARGATSLQVESGHVGLWYSHFWLFRPAWKADSQPHGLP